MAILGCFSVLVGKKKKIKAEEVSTYLVNGNGNLKANLERPIEPSEGNELYSTTFSATVPFGILEKSECTVEVANLDSPVEAEAAEAAYEGSDEHDDSSSIRREFSDFDLQAQVSDREQTGLPLMRKTSSYDSVDIVTNNQLQKRYQRNAELDHDLIQSGHVSDPGMKRADFWASPILKRSCSNLETRDMLRKGEEHLPPKRSCSFEDLQNSTDSMQKEVVDEIHASPVSVTTPRSADKVMLKKHSSSQVLPSRSKKIWWKLFLWSHRNTHKSRMDKLRLSSIKYTSDQKGGYCSDTLEPNRGTESSMVESPGSFSGKCKMDSNSNWDRFHSEVSGILPQNQWLAFSTESSSLTRVDEWVSSVHDQTLLPINDDETVDEDIFFPPSPETSGSPARTAIRHGNLNISEELLHANSVIQSLNSSSTVAHITGMNLKVVPTISRFSSLRSINLSGNFIVHVTPGSLPKGLHTLNLSRNRIVAIEGLKDLTRLRVLDISYNRISRIGQGLSSCNLIKELYLSGNKISNVEGLHRLLKLTVLDLSFNKITTTKALGQLVANYSSLLALNLLGNPIQGNVGDDQLRKVVLGLLPRLAYLNKQPIKPQRAREAATNSVAKAALGTGGWASRRKLQKQIGTSGSSTSYGHKSTLGERKNKRLSSKIGNSSMKRK